MVYPAKTCCRLIGAAAVVAAGVLASQSALAQGVSIPDGPVACDAVARLPLGSWTVLRPVTISPGGRTIGLAPGQTFAPNQMYNGVEVTAVLDRNCGNH